MTYLLDTNACISHLRSTSLTVTRHLAAHAPQDVVLCAVVKAELLFGALRSSLPAQNLAKLDAFFAGFQSLPFDDVAARSYGTIREALERAGTPIGPNDLMIASIALSRGLTLVTHNTREFGRVSGLQTEDWQSATP